MYGLCTGLHPCNDHKSIIIVIVIMFLFLLEVPALAINYAGQNPYNLLHLDREPCVFSYDNAVTASCCLKLVLPGNQHPGANQITHPVGWDISNPNKWYS